MAPEPVKCTLKSFGTFSQPSFGGVGEPYQDGRQRESRTTGRQFTTNKMRKGQVGDNWNRGQHGKRQGFQLMFEGEKYAEMHKIESKFAVEEAKKNLTTNGFRYSSKPKQNSGLGAYWGCIGPKAVHMPDFDVIKHGDIPGPVKHELKQVSTSPSKKGSGSSTPGICFGPGPKEGESGMGRYGGREYAHVPDPYDLARQKELAMAKEHTEAMLGRAPMKTMSKAVDFFDQKKDRVASSLTYTEDPRVPERPPKEGSPFKNVSDAPFKPARAPRSGPQGTFNKFPEYKEDPWDLKIKKAQEEAAANRREGAAPFKPTGNPHTTPNPSIVFHVPGGGP